MGVERYRKITTRPRRFHCRLILSEDRDLSGFDYPEKLVAGGVKYAERLVIVVSDNSWRPSPALLSFSKARSVQIVRLPLSTLSPELVERMKTLHFISTALKKHPSQDSIVNRFVPDIFRH